MANLLVVKSFPRVRGVVPLYGVDINGTAVLPRTRGVVPNSMLEAQHSGTLSPLSRGYLDLF